MKKRLPPLTVTWISGTNNGSSHWAHVTFLDYDGAVLSDERKRIVGAELRIEKGHRDGAVCWDAWPHATREGRHYGASQPSFYAATLEDAKAYLGRYARAAHARMARKFGRVAPLVESLEASLKQRGAR